MKIYIVTRGSYSDYHVVSVFSTRELAEMYVRTDPDANIEEYEMDAIAEQLRAGYRPITISMSRDGRSSISRLNRGYQGLELYADAQGAELYGTIYARDEYHAAKIANELRVRLIASGEWDRSIKENS